MSTNFYWKRDIDIPVNLLPKKLKTFGARVAYAINDHEEDDDSMLIHIGKRSSAGFYCFECGTTLFKEGTQHIHSANSNDEYKWWSECPVCHAKSQMEYNKNSIIRRICSWTYTTTRHYDLLKTLRNPSIVIVMKLSGQDYCCIDEYGVSLTADEMVKEIDSNPIKFQLPGLFS